MSNQSKKMKELFWSSFCNIGNLPIAANTIDKSRDHDKLPFAKRNKPYLKIPFENLYSLHWVSQGFHYTHKQSLARVPLLGYREIIERDLPFPIPVTFPQHGWRYILQWYWDSLPVGDYNRIIEAKHERAKIKWQQWICKKISAIIMVILQTTPKV